MSWDWSVLLLLDAGLLLLATAVILALFLRDLRRGVAADTKKGTPGGAPPEQQL